MCGVRSREESEGSRGRRVGCGGCKIAILCVVEMIWLGSAGCCVLLWRVLCVLCFVSRLGACCVAVE